MTHIRLPTLSYHSKSCNFSLEFLSTYDKVYMPRPGWAEPGRFLGLTDVIRTGARNGRRNSS